MKTFSVLMLSVVVVMSVLVGIKLNGELTETRMRDLAQKVNNIDKSHLSELHASYKRLSNYYPDNQEYKKLAQRYEEKVQQRAAIAQAKKEAAEENRRIANLPRWETSYTRYHMTGEVQHFARSPATTSIAPLSSPFGDVATWIGVGCSSNKLWTYFGFDDLPNLTSSEQNSGNYVSYSNIKFDEQASYQIKLTKDQDTKLLYVSKDEDFINNVKQYNTVILEMEWQTLGNIIFEYPLRGSTKAINEIFDSCGLS